MVCSIPGGGDRQGRQQIRSHPLSWRKWRRDRQIGSCVPGVYCQQFPPGILGMRERAPSRHWTSGERFTRSFFDGSGLMHENFFQLIIWPQDSLVHYQHSRSLRVVVPQFSTSRVLSQTLR